MHLCAELRKQRFRCYRSGAVGAVYGKFQTVQRKMNGAFDVINVIPHRVFRTGDGADSLVYHHQMLDLFLAEDDILNLLFKVVRQLVAAAAEDLDAVVFK